MTPPQRHSPLIQHKPHISRRLAIEIYVRRGDARALGIDGRRGADDFNVQTACEGFEMGHDEFAGVFDVCCWQEVCELREAEGNEDADDVGVVAEVEVEGLVCGEGEGVVGEGGVDLCGGG